MGWLKHIKLSSAVSMRFMVVLSILYGEIDGSKPVVRPYQNHDRMDKVLEGFYIPLGINLWCESVCAAGCARTLGCSGEKDGYSSSAVI